MTTTTYRNLTRNFFGLFDTRDLDALIDAVDERFVFNRPTRHGGVPDGTTTIEGRHRFRKFLRERYPAPPSRHNIDIYCERDSVAFVSGTIDYPAESRSFEWIGRLRFGVDAKVCTLHVSLYPNEQEWSR